MLVWFSIGNCRGGGLFEESEYALDFSLGEKLLLGVGVSGVLWKGNLDGNSG